MIHLVILFMKEYLFLRPPAVLRLTLLLAAVLLYGMTGFLYFELPGNPELTWSDGLWYTVVTMTTVGYGDLFPRTAGGRFFVGWPIMFFGIGLLGYTLSVIAASLVTSKTREMKGMSSFSLRDHLIIFNFSGLSKVVRILDELSLDPGLGRSMQAVLVDEGLEELPPELLKRGIRFVRGNPVRDETLDRASIGTARDAIVLCRDPGNSASDNLNVAITLVIEARNRKLNTVVECVDPESEALLRKAGCDKVVCLSRFDSYFLSQEVLNPGVQEVIADLLSAKGGQQIYLAEVGFASDFEGLRRLCRAKGHIALGVICERGMLLNVAGDFAIQTGDRVISIGPSRLDLSGISSSAPS
ncbi:MAG: ion channel [Thermodesulfobacteriota bacterium]